MQYVLTEAEWKEYQRIKGKASHFEYRNSQMEKRVDSIDEEKARVQKAHDAVVSNKNRKIEQLRQEIRNLQSQSRSRTINVGTYPVPMALKIAETLRKNRNNKNLRTSRYGKVRIKGRGPRVVDGKRIGSQSDIALSKATGAAIYVDLK
jgi:predicted methyltransferase